MVRNKYLAEIILKNYRVASICPLAVEALTELGHYCRMSI